MSSPVTPEIHGRDSSLGKTTHMARTACVVNSPELSDIKFIFTNVSGTGSTNGHGQGQGGRTIIYGHKLILALASPVFRKMFYLDNTSQQFVTTVNDEVDMDDNGFSAEAFLEFIRFLYTDQICYKDLDFEVIVGILSCADYYDVPCLKVECVEHLKTMIWKENVIRILEIGKLYELENLAAEALEFIDHNLGAVVGESEEFFCIKLETLYEILKRDSLDSDERLILNLALLWAGKECERKNRKPTAENKREVLGKVFFEIRFRLLTADKISLLVSSNLLSARESVDILLEVHTPGYVTTAFNSNSKRIKLAPQVSFKSNLRVFGQKKKLIEVREMEQEWKEKNHFDYWKLVALARTPANLLFRGFPSNKTEYELLSDIERAKGRCVVHVKVNKMNENHGEFHVQFNYNSFQCRLTDLVDPAWYEFDNPHSIQISEWDDNDDN